jgi:hypothetical protein
VIYKYSEIRAIAIIILNNNMAFIPGILPVVDTRSNPAMSPQINPLEGGKLERGTKAVVRTQTNSKANNNDREQDKRTGRRDSPMRRMPNERRLKTADRFEIRGKGKYTLTSSDFGFEIQGSSTPTLYTASKDQTLFRDYNQGGSLPAVSLTESVNSVTNSIKLLRIDLAEGIAISRGYAEAWKDIVALMKNDVIVNTKSAKGATDRITEPAMRNYFSVVSRAFDMLIQLEVIQAWSPASNDYYDSSLRQLSAKSATPELLRARTTLRQALIPHVLPRKLTTYIRWIRETKLRNQSPESTKLRFSSQPFITLSVNLVDGHPYTSFLASITNIVAEVDALEGFLPAILINNVDCVDLIHVKEQYNMIHNSAVYDPEFNNIWNNRSVAINPGGGGVDDVYPRCTEGKGIGSFETTNPSVLALTTIGQQQFPATACLPFEGNIDLAGCAPSGSLCNRFFYYIGVSGSLVIKGLDSWFQVVDDSMHITNTDMVFALSGVSSPKGVNTAAYVLADSNIQMACRESLTEMFVEIH